MFKNNRQKGSKAGNTHKKRKGAKHNKSEGERAGTVATIGIHGNTVNSSIYVNTTSGTGELEKEHRQEMEKVGRVSTSKSELIAIRGYVNGTLWKKKKFINTAKEMDFHSDLCLTVLSHLRVGKQDRRNFWIRSRKHIYRCLGTKRNNVVTSMKKGFMGKGYCKHCEQTRSRSHFVILETFYRVDERY